MSDSKKREKCEKPSEECPEAEAEGTELLYEYLRQTNPIHQAAQDYVHGTSGGRTTPSCTISTWLAAIRS
ncbi:hypothetical protein ACHAWF_002363 [Thalassiosira exigua]